MAGKHNKIGQALCRNLNILSKKDDAPKKDTINHYIRIVTRFSKWVEETEHTKRVDPERYRELGQKWINERIEGGISPHTIHTDVAALSRAMGYKMEAFSYPMRTAPTKGRGGVTWDGNGTRLHEISRKIGIRSNEYADLRKDDLIRHDGHLYVIVRQGKGGKYQEQLIKPEYEKTVISFFNDVRGKDGYILTKEERDHARKDNTHAGRREYAREMYEYFLNLPEREKDYYRKEMERRFKENPRKAENEAWKTYQDQLKSHPVIATRDETRRALIDQGKSPFLDREAMMMTSVFCLAHYRTNVAINNYVGR